MKKIFFLEKGMTQSISHFSRHDEASTKINSNGTYAYMGNSSLTAKSKTEQFYRRVRCVILIGALVAFFSSQISIIGASLIKEGLTHYHRP